MSFATPCQQISISNDQPNFTVSICDNMKHIPKTPRNLDTPSSNKTCMDTRIRNLSKRKLNYSVEKPKIDKDDESEECEFIAEAVFLGNNLTVVKEQENVEMEETNEDSYSFTLESSVSSLALSRDGDCIIAGFNDGLIRLFPLSKSLSKSYRYGLVLGQIQARGMYTSLMVHVAVPEDGKYAFAGVYRGSTEMTVFDMSTYEPPEIQPIPASSGEYATIERISHSDAKLKGFGAVTQYKSKRSQTGVEYRLFCGLGIKNIHIWQFFIGLDGEVVWNCIFDKQTNGMTVELVSFRNNGTQAISKSHNQNIRVWDISSIGKDCENNNIPFQDIQNTHDSIAVFSDQAYGGSDALSVVSLTKDSGTRIELPLPNSKVERKGNRRRRCMRSVKSVFGTCTGSHIIVQCSDGSLLYQLTSKELGVHSPLHHLLTLDEGDNAVVSISNLHLDKSPLLALATSRELKLQLLSSLQENSSTNPSSHSRTRIRKGRSRRKVIDLEEPCSKRKTPISKDSISSESTFSKENNISRTSTKVCGDHKGLKKQRRDETFMNSPKTPLTKTKPPSMESLKTPLKDNSLNTTPTTTTTSGCSKTTKPLVDKNASFMSPSTTGISKITKSLEKKDSFMSPTMVSSKTTKSYEKKESFISPIISSKTTQSLVEKKESLMSPTLVSSKTAKATDKNLNVMPPIAPSKKTYTMEKKNIKITPSVPGFKTNESMDKVLTKNFQYAPSKSIQQMDKKLLQGSPLTCQLIPSLDKTIVKIPAPFSKSTQSSNNKSIIKVLPSSFTCRSTDNSFIKKPTQSNDKYNNNVFPPLLTSKVINSKVINSKVTKEISSWNSENSSNPTKTLTNLEKNLIRKILPVRDLDSAEPNPMTPHVAKKCPVQLSKSKIDSSSPTSRLEIGEQNIPNDRDNRSSLKETTAKQQFSTAKQLDEKEITLKQLDEKEHVRLEQEKRWSMLSSSFKESYERLWTNFKDEINRQNAYQSLLIANTSFDNGNSQLWKKKRICQRYRKERANTFIYSEKLPQLKSSKEIVKQYQAIVKSLLNHHKLEADALRSRHQLEILVGNWNTEISSCIPFPIEFPYDDLWSMY